MTKLGRPSKYRERYAADIIEFFSQPTVKEVTQVIRSSGWIKTATEYRAVFFPTFELFAAKIGVSDNTLENWAKVYPEFLGAYTRARSMQKGILQECAMLRYYDTRAAQFMLINNHGMTSKKKVQTITERTDEYAQLTDEQLFMKAQAYTSRISTLRIPYAR